MAPPSVTLYRMATNIVLTGGSPVTPIFGPVLGGLLQNPLQAQDQGLAASEALYVDIINPADTEETPTTTRIEPGGIFPIPANLAGNVSVNSKSAGHKFSGFVVQPSTPFPPSPQAGIFPPAGPTTLTKIVPSYPYQQYNDDEAIDAFFTAYNSLAQSYLDWFVQTPLPVYTNPAISGTLLDWVAAGLYGMARPTLSSGRNRTLGPYNTVAYNTLPFNVRKLIGPKNISFTTDDIFKRILTWNLYRGDGMVFNVRWLKRRIMRFLMGPNGTAPNVDNTSPISVTIGLGTISIRINVGTRTILGGAIYNRFGYNRMAYNRLITQAIPGPTPLPFQTVLKQALESGVLVLPFQPNVTISA